MILADYQCDCTILKEGAAGMIVYCVYWYQSLVPGFKTLLYALHVLHPFFICTSYHPNFCCHTFTFDTSHLETMIFIENPAKLCHLTVLWGHVEICLCEIIGKVVNYLFLISLPQKEKDCYCDSCMQYQQLSKSLIVSDLYIALIVVPNK